MMMVSYASSSGHCPSPTLHQVHISETGKLQWHHDARPAPPTHPRATSTRCSQVSAIDTKCLCYLYSLYDQGQTIEAQQSSGDSQSAMCSNSLTSHVLDNTQELYTPKSVFQGKNQVLTDWLSPHLRNSRAADYDCFWSWQCIEMRTPESWIYLKLITAHVQHLNIGSRSMDPGTKSGTQCQGLSPQTLTIRISAIRTLTSVSYEQSMRFRIQRNLPLETRAFLNVIAEIPSSNTRKQKLISRVAWTTPIPHTPSHWFSQSDI